MKKAGKVMEAMASVLVALVLVGGSACAGEANFSKTYHQCMQNVGSADDASTCMDNEAAWLDKQMVEAYKKVMGKLSDRAEKAVLQKSQQAWEQYMKSNCEVVQMLVMGDVSEQACRMEMQAVRIKELRDMQNN